MHVLLAPASFKESLDARAAAEAMARGVARGAPGATWDSAPVADGGSGTLEAILRARGGRLDRVSVAGPLGEPLEAALGLLDDGRTAVVESAQAVGLARVPRARRDPLRGSSRGVGELIRAALDRGATRILVGVGDTATSDGGAGAAAALGARCPGLEAPPRAGDLGRLAGLDLAGLDPRLGACELRVACDVSSPLLGPGGAARVFAPQKGATPGQVEELEAGLERFARLALESGSRVAPGAPGAGAGGGLAFGLAALCGAALLPGAELVLDQVRLAQRLARAHLVLTGEGRLDAQSRRGKAPLAVAHAARRAGVPVVALAGQVAPGARDLVGRELDGCFGLADGPMSLEDSQARAAELLERLATSVVATFRAGRREDIRPGPAA